MGGGPGCLGRQILRSRVEIRGMKVDGLTGRRLKGTELNC